MLLAGLTLLLPHAPQDARVGRGRGRPPCDSGEHGFPPVHGSTVLGQKRVKQEAGRVGIIMCVRGGGGGLRLPWNATSIEAPGRSTTEPIDEVEIDGRALPVVVLGWDARARLGLHGGRQAASRKGGRRSSRGFCVVGGPLEAFAFGRRSTSTPECSWSQHPPSQARPSSSIPQGRPQAHGIGRHPLAEWPSWVDGSAVTARRSTAASAPRREQVSRDPSLLLTHPAPTQQITTRTGTMIYLVTSQLFQSFLKGGRLDLEQKPA